MRKVPLGDLIRPAKKERAGSRELPVLSMTMADGLVDQSDRFKKRIASENTDQYLVVRKGQLVVGFPIDEGVLCFQKKYGEAIVSPAYGLWDLISSSVDHEYLERFLKSPSAIRYYTAKLRNTTARRRTISSDSFLALAVPLPAVSEQRRICAILRQAQELKEKRLRANQKFRELKNAIFVSTFRTPNGGRTLRLGDIVSMSSGDGLTSKMQKGGSVPVYGGNGVNGWHNEANVGDNTIVIGRVGVYCGAIHRTDRPAWVTDNALIATPRFEISPRYLEDALRMANLNQYASVSSQPLISAGRLKDIEIVVADPSTQRDYESALACLEREAAITQTAASRLSGLLASLQHRAFRGEL